MKRWKKAVALALCLALALPMGAGAANETVEHAYDLNDLGLFLGTDAGFELDKRPTRVEGLTMFVRLLGGEREATERNYAHPFTDVPGWGDAYVGYAWEKGLTRGTGKELFGSTAYITLEEYVTFVLRALGYDDSRGDFSWNTSVDKAVEIGLLTREQAVRFLGEATSRGTMVDVSYAALTQTFKGEERTLAEKLVEEGAFTRELAIQKGVWTAPVPDVTPSPTESVKPSETPRPTETPKPTETPAPVESVKPSERPAPVETPVEDHALVIAVGSNSGKVFKGPQLQVMDVEGVKTIITVNEDSKYGWDVDKNGKLDDKAVTAEDYSVGDIVVWTGRANNATVTIKESVSNAGAAYVEGTRSVNGAPTTADCVLFAEVKGVSVLKNGKGQNEVSGASYKTYNIRDLRDVETSKASTVVTNSEGKVVVVFMDLEATPGSVTNNTIYGIVTGRTGRGNASDGSPYHTFNVASNEETYTVNIATLAGVSVGDMIALEPTADEIYSSDEVTILDTVGAIDGDTNLKAVWAKEYNDRDKTLTFFEAVEEVEECFMGVRDSQNTLALDDDCAIVYVNAKDKKGGTDMGGDISEFDSVTGYKNVAIVTSTDSRGYTVIVAIFVETSNKCDILP